MKSPMMNDSLVFALEVDYRDAIPQRELSEVVATPKLEVFSNATIATTSNEGINIVEGDLWFFAADGSPLEALFSEEPYVDNKKQKYFAGKYFLRAGRGKSLQEVISDILPHTGSSRACIIVRVPASDNGAQEYGWQDALAMKSNVEQALKILPPDMAELVVFE